MENETYKIEAHIKKITGKAVLLYDVTGNIQVEAWVPKSTIKNWSDKTQEGEFVSLEIDAWIVDKGEGLEEFLANG